MPSTKYLLIYATESRLPRRTIAPDEDWEIADIDRHLLPGESGLVVERAEVHAHGHEHAWLAKHVGPRAHSGRCVLLRHAASAAAPHVLGPEHCIMADPALDRVPGHRVIAHEHAGPGWVWDGAQLWPPEAEAEA